LCEDQRLNHQLPVTAGVLAKESTDILAEFFQRLRQRKRQTHKKESPSKDLLIAETLPSCKEGLDGT
jgi:hypothetical protein